MYTYGYLFYIPVTLAALIFFVIRGYCRKLDNIYYVFAFIAVVYINVAVKEAFFPMFMMDIPDFTIWNNINYLPRPGYFLSSHALLNIMMTVPIGCGIQYLFDLERKKRWMLGILLGTMFEVIRLVILVWIQPLDMFVDVNDLIANILGVLIGTGIVSIFNRLVIKFLSNNSKSRNRFWKYIYTVAENCLSGRSSLKGLAKRS